MMYRPACLAGVSRHLAIQSTMTDSPTRRRETLDPFDFFGDAIDGMAEWQYTPGWGNLFTVVVATAAIIASVVVSKITLKRNAAQFEQTRLDKRNDKLRAEVIDLISALSERSSQADIAVQRIKRLEKIDLQTLYENIKAIMSENLWDSYRRAESHACAVLLLTEDKQAVEATGLILEALGKQRRMFEDAANPLKAYTVDGPEVDNLSYSIDAVTERIKSYAARELGVTAYDERGYPVNKLAHLK